MIFKLFYPHLLTGYLAGLFWYDTFLTFYRNLKKEILCLFKPLLNPEERFISF